jgi:hypothetical protein
MHRRFYSLGCCLFSASLFLGCGRGSAHPELVPVTGTVMYNDAPVAGAEVSFFAAGAPRAASDITDAEGKFSLSMFEPGDGTMAGENIITVSKMEGGPTAAVSATPSSGPPDPAALAAMSQKRMNSGGGVAVASGPKSLVPEKYSKRETTPLKEVISPTNNKIPIKLVD